MADNKQRVTQYFSNIVVRTMAKDLQSLAAGGGLISYSPEQQPKLEIKSASQAVEPPQIIQPPEIQLPQADTLPRAGTDTFRSAFSPLPSESKPLDSRLEVVPPGGKKDASSVLLYGLLASLGIILLASAGYWLVYPRLAERLRPAPTPPAAPIVSQEPSPSPSPMLNIEINPNAYQSSRLVLETLESKTLTTLLAEDLAFPMPTSTLRVYSLFTPEEKQLTSLELAKLMVPNALESFKSSLDSRYLVFSYYQERTAPYLGTVFSIKPQSLQTAKTIMKNWESAGVEEYFPALYVPYNTSKRREDRFKDVTLEGTVFRQIPLISENPKLELIYGFKDAYLIIATNAEAIQTILKNL